MKYIRLFNDLKAVSVKFSGGKGANLAILTQNGFPVPPGFIVSAEAYKKWFNNLNGLELGIDELKQDSSNRDEIAHRCKVIRSKLSGIDLPAEIQREVSEALHTFPGTAFSVRSSSTLEDMDMAAFAGQHETFLNVREDEIIKRIKQCFISLWEERAVLYRLKQGFRIKEASMAVVVQQMVESRASGVAFSINPVNGHGNEIVIDANFGLGESVVAGEVSVDHYIVEKENLAILDKTIGTKEFKIVSDNNGTSKVRMVNNNIECLTGMEIRQLCTEVEKIERVYRFPQDIEWAFADEKLYILQSRPITTIPACWTREESGERFPNAMTPLSWEFSEAGFHESLKFSLKLMGFPSFNGKWFAMFNNYIYGNQNAVSLFINKHVIPFTSLAELERFIPEAMEKFGWVLELPVVWTRDLDKYLLKIGSLMSEKLENKSLKETWEHILTLDNAGREYFKPNIAISITHGILHKTLFQFLLLFYEVSRAKELYDKLTRYCETKTSVINREIFELYSMANEEPALKKLLLEKDRKCIVNQELLTNFNQFKERFDSFIESHGHRETDPDPYHPHWGDAPWVVLDNIALMLRSSCLENPRDKELEGKIDQLNAEKEIYNFIDPKYHLLFSELSRLARVYTAIDDIEHYQTTRLNFVFRKSLLTLGQKLMCDGVLDMESDIFFASRPLLENVIFEKSPQSRQELQESVKSNKHNYQRNREKSPSWSLEDRQPEYKADGISTLKGLAGSPGIVEGEVYIINSTEEFAHFPDKAILVARTTNPSWTPLFYSASGLITESGGPLSHGAVTAREMKVPAVMALKGCMSLLKSGQKVRIDGHTGIITLLG